MSSGRSSIGAELGLAAWQREGAWMVKRNGAGRPVARMTAGAWLAGVVVLAGLIALREKARDAARARARRWLRREDLRSLEPLATLLIDRLFDSRQLAVRPI